MSISQTGKWIVAVCAGIGVIFGAIKSLSDVAKNLNGWHVLFLLSLFALCGVSIDFWLQSLKKQFASLQKSIQDLTPKPISQPPLRLRVLALCDDLRHWAAQLGVRPSDDALYRTGMSSAEFHAAYAKSVLPWELKCFHGYQLEFAERVYDMSHELGVIGIGDNALDAALVQMNRGFDGITEQPVATIIESLAKLASEIPYSST